jgi:hypothetical protein
MRIKIIITAFFLSPLCFLCCIGQIKIPNGFKMTIPPEVSTDKWFVLNHSMNEFGVQNVNGQLEVKKVKEIDTGRLEVFGGHLLGIDHGEFGGCLSFIPTDTTFGKRIIKHGNIKFIFSFKDKIYFIDALAHGGISRGFLFELDTTRQQFTYKKIVDFEDAPEAYTIFGDKILIASHKGFYIVKDFQKELIIKDAFWRSLYPNSIAAFNDENIFIGLRGGIVRLNLLAKKLIFYQHTN